MNKATNHNRTIGILLIRVLLGIIFFFQGFGKVFTYGVDQVHEMFFKPSFQTAMPGGETDYLLPEWLTQTTAYFTSYAELICGALLVIGLFRNYSLYILGLVLLVVSFGHGLIEPIWDLSHVMYRAILLVALLLLPGEWDKISLDSILQKNKSA